MYTFADYRLRPVTEADRAHLEAWIEANPDHRGRFTADFFIAPSAPGFLIESFVVEDEEGAVFYFRQERPIRFHMEFGPATTAQERERNRKALEAGCEWLTEMARQAGATELISQTDSANLANFCEKRLGFRKVSGELVKGIAALNTDTGQGKALQPLHQAT